MFEDDPVCGYLFPLFKKHYVSGYEPLCVDRHGLFVAQYAHHRRHQPQKRFHRFVRFVLLPKAKGSVDDDRRRDRIPQNVVPLARCVGMCHKCQNRRNLQKHGKKLHILFEVLFEVVLFLRACYFVGTEIV